MLTRKQLTQLRRSPLNATNNRIKTAMKLAGLTQIQVAAAVGVAQSQVSEDAAGKFSDVSLTKARAYADLFGCDVDDIFPKEQALAS
jgi:transcriptional regulator with XRE-family HTH domain